ncbi:MAG: radical SAM protein, partial [Burkholderiaceae bacterium]|nr:radical SAM protein [Burkholderiaceae bacterium]
MSPSKNRFVPIAAVPSEAEQADGRATVAPPRKGRGTAWQIAHRFHSDEREGFDDGWGTLDQLADEEHLPPATQIIEEQARRVVNTNSSPDIFFELSLNPYRGCEH